MVIDGQPTHQTNYDVRKHVRVYLGLNNMPLERKDDDPELVYGVERAVSGRAQNGIRPQIIFMERKKCPSLPPQLILRWLWIVNCPNIFKIGPAPGNIFTDLRPPLLLLLLQLDRYHHPLMTFAAANQHPQRLDLQQDVLPGPGHRPPGPPRLLLRDGVPHLRAGRPGRPGGRAAVRAAGDEGVRGRVGRHLLAVRLQLPRPGAAHHVQVPLRLQGEGARELHALAAALRGQQGRETAF